MALTVNRGTSAIWQSSTETGSTVDVNKLKIEINDLRTKIEEAKTALKDGIDKIWHYKNQLNKLEIIEKSKGLSPKLKEIQEAYLDGIKIINKHIKDSSPMEVIEQKEQELAIKEQELKASSLFMPAA